MLNSTKQASERMGKALAQLVVYHPFFFRVIAPVEWVECEILPDGKPLWAMATDMKRIFWNPKWVMESSTTLSNVMAVMAHEGWHIASGHGWRMEWRKPDIWGIATDYRINGTLIQAGHKFPTDKNGKLMVYHDNKFDGWPEEKIYKHLEDRMPPQPNDQGSQGDGQGQGQDSGQGNGQGDPRDIGGVMKPTNDDGSELSDYETAVLKEEIRQRVIAAAEYAKAVGKFPGGMEGIIELANRSKIDWRQHMQSWIKAGVPDEYSFSRPASIPLAYHGLYLPSLIGTSSGTGGLSIDCSGSVSDNELRKNVANIASIIEDTKPDKLYIILHDYVVHKVYEWHRGDDFSHLKILGRGGTRITPTFEAVNKLEDRIDWLVCFTDMEIGDFPKPSQAPHYPVLWASTGGQVNPGFGTIIDIRETF